MLKEKSSSARKIIYWITSHPWLKFISLLLAILAWLYVKGKISGAG